MSSPSYSFVIPVLNDCTALERLLPVLRRQFPAAEVLVVDGGSTDTSVVKALHDGVQLLIGAPGRAAQMNLGARAASGDYLLFLHADTRPRFSEELLEKWMSVQPLWGFCRVRLSGEGAALRVIESAMNVRSRLTRVATGDQLLVVQRNWFLEQGAFAEQPLMEDVELCKRLRRMASPTRLDAVVQTSSRRWEEQGVASTVLRMWALRLAYVCGVSPLRLWRHYYGR